MPRFTVRRALSCVALVASTTLLLRSNGRIPQQLAEPWPLQLPPPVGVVVSPAPPGLPPPVKQRLPPPTPSAESNVRAHMPSSVAGSPSVPVQASGITDEPLAQPHNWPPTRIPAGLVPRGRKPSDWIATVPLLEVHGDGHEIVLTAPHGIPLARESCIGGSETWACTGTFKMAVRHGRANLAASHCHRCVNCAHEK